MMPAKHEILEAVEEARVLGVFGGLCKKYSQSADLKRLRNIYARTDNPLKTTSAIVERDANTYLSLAEVARLHELIMAFLRKSSFRRSISVSEREGLLKKQRYRCAFCNAPIDSHAHADHIVPFKYVGDELSDNFQMLCSNCNTKKNADLFYQIKFLLGLV